MWALALSLVGAVFAFGMRIGVLTERIDNQSHQLESVTKKLDSLSIDFAGTRGEMMRILESQLDNHTPPGGRDRVTR